MARLARKGLQPREGRPAERHPAVDVKSVRAKVYKEASWFDQQETIVLDYSKTSRLAHKIRDEIREVSPGVYLGLVFWGRNKILYFTLTSKS